MFSIVILIISAFNLNNKQYNKINYFLIQKFLCKNKSKLLIFRDNKLNNAFTNYSKVKRSCNRLLIIT